MASRLTIYLISGWLQTSSPNLDLLSHTSGHQYSPCWAKKGDPALAYCTSPATFFWLCFYLLSTAWNVLSTTLSVANCCNNRSISHYSFAIRRSTAFVMILLGFLLQWPFHLADLGPCLPVLPLDVRDVWQSPKRRERTQSAHPTTHTPSTPAYPS